MNTKTQSNNQPLAAILARDLTRQRLDENLHSSSEAQDEMESRFFLNVVVGEGTAVLQLFPGENEALLVRGDAFFVLDFSLDILDRVGGFHLEGDGLSREGLNEDLHCAVKIRGEKLAKKKGHATCWGKNFRMTKSRERVRKEYEKLKLMKHR